MPWSETTGGSRPAARAMSGRELPYVSTVDAAMDLDVVRQALGDAKMNYLGFSYGTFLGATYASLFPTHIRAMVLDGALDPAQPVIAELDTQAAGLDGQLEQFFANCAATRRAPGSPGPTRTPPSRPSSPRVQVVPSPGISKSRERWAPPSCCTERPRLSIRPTLGVSSPPPWPKPRPATAPISFSCSTPTQNATRTAPTATCSKPTPPSTAWMSPPRPSPRSRRPHPAAEAAAPVFGVQNLYSEIGCAVWPLPATGKVGPIHATGAPAIVVVGSTGDPVTPYVWAQALASELGHGVLLTRVGDGHTGYRSSSCVRAAVDTYLVDLTPPASGTRCPSN